MTCSFFGRSPTRPASTGTNTIAGTDPLLVEYPTSGGSITSSHYGLLICISKAAATIGTVDTPGSWTSLVSLVGGTGTNGVDTGPVRLQVFGTQFAGGETGTLSLTRTGNKNTSFGCMIAIASDLGAGVTYSTGASTGDDTSTGTPLSATMAADPGIAAGDFVLCAGGAPTDVDGGTDKYTLTLTITGITNGTLTNLYTVASGGGTPNTSQGNDCGAAITYNVAASGTSSAAAAVSWAVGGTNTNVAGPIGLVRVRDVAAATSHLLACAGAGK